MPHGGQKSKHVIASGLSFSYSAYHSVRDIWLFLFFIFYFYFFFFFFWRLGSQWPAQGGSFEAAQWVEPSYCGKVILTIRKCNQHVNALLSAGAFGFSSRPGPCEVDTIVDGWSLQSS